MKTLIATFVLSIATVFAVNAQTTKDEKKDMSAETMETQPERTVEDRAQMRTGMMAKDLDLNDEQRQNLMEQNERYYSDYDRMNSRDMEAADRKDMRTRSMNDYDENMKEIMDEKQYKDYSSMKNEYNKEDDLLPERATTPNNRDVDNYERPR
jgi:Spy/CpxP family protein refolding chaperone